MFDKNKVIKEKLDTIKNPVILELGVNRGRSTKRFIDHIELNGGELYSIDIKDCSNAIISNKWNFLQCNDLNRKKIIETFPNLNNGIDLLFIDSYHDPYHVRSLLLKWFYFVKKKGFIFFDDTESYLYRIKKNYILAMINDSINSEIKDFYHQNYDQLIYTKYFHGSGLAEFYKVSELNTHPNKKKIWRYNYLISRIYLLLKKINFYFFKSKFKD
mgnify:FL=1